MNKTPKYYALGLRLGITSTDEVQNWVNREISEKENPSDQLIELAYIKKDNIHELYHALLEIKDDTDTYQIIKQLLTEINNKKLESIEFCRDLARNLYSIWVENDYKAPDELKEIGFFDDEFDLAAIGSYGTLGEVHEDFKRFVNSFASNS